MYFINLIKNFIQALICFIFLQDGLETDKEASSFQENCTLNLQPHFKAALRKRQVAKFGTKPFGPQDGIIQGLKKLKISQIDPEFNKEASGFLIFLILLSVSTKIIFLCTFSCFFVV